MSCESDKTIMVYKKKLQQAFINGIVMNAFTTPGRPNEHIQSLNSIKIHLFQNITEDPIGADDATHHQIVNRAFKKHLR